MLMVYRLGWMSVGIMKVLFKKEYLSALDLYHMIFTVEEVIHRLLLQLMCTIQIPLIMLRLLRIY